MREAREVGEPMPRSIKKRCAYQSEWKSPWKPDKARPNVCVTRWPLWVRHLSGRRGVYLIRCKFTKRVLYIGRAVSCLRQVFQRHFRVWGDDPSGLHYHAVFDREKVEAKVYVVRVTEWVKPTEADLIFAHNPLCNIRMEQSNRTPCDDEVPF